MQFLLNISWWQGFINWLITKDKQAFLFVNQNHVNPFFDWLMPLWRNDKTWIPLYISIIFFVWFKLKKQAYLWVLSAIITVAITDQVSSHIFKPLFARPRPCADIDFSPKVRLLLEHCSNGFSFLSSHACNHFGIALFIITTLSTYLKNWKYAFIIWALLVCYAQVYVGVHYPLDVLCGGLLGAFIGNITGYVWLIKVSRIKL